MRGEFLSLTFPAGGVLLAVSLPGLSSQVSVAMDIAVGCWLSSGGGISASLRLHCSLEGDLAAVSALQLQEKKQTLMNIMHAVHLLFLKQMRPNSKPRSSNQQQQWSTGRNPGWSARMAVLVPEALNTAQYSSANWVITLTPASVWHIKSWVFTGHFHAHKTWGSPVGTRKNL